MIQIVQFSRPPIPLSSFVQHFATPFTSDVQFQTTSPPIQMISYQLKGNIILGWLLYLILSGLSFRSAFVFSINSLILSCLSTDFTIYFFVALHTCVCSYSKISRNFFWKIVFLVLILQSTCFISIIWKRK